MSNLKTLLRQLFATQTGVCLLALGHLPYLIAYYWQLWETKTHYQFFPFAIGLFVWLVVSRAEPDPSRNRKLRIGLVVLDVLMLASGVLLHFPWVTVAGLWLLLFSVCLGLRDRGYSHSLGYLCLIPLLTLRPPRNIDVIIIQWLQSITTRVASRLLHEFGFLHLREGNVLEFPGKRFMVEEACSGVQSLFTLLFLAVLITCFRRRKLFHVLAVLVFAAFFAGVMNIFRVCSIAVAWQSYGIDLSSGWQHDMIGYIALLVAAGLVLSADACISFFTDWVPPMTGVDFTVATVNPLTHLWNKLFAVTQSVPPSSSPIPSDVQSRRRPAWLATGVVLCLACVSLQAFALREQLTESNRLGTSRVDVLSEDSLPKNIAGFVMSGYDTETRRTADSNGEFSNMWAYSGSGMNVRLSCDHPFCDWHELTVCYTNTGWSILSREELNDGSGWYGRLVTMQKADTGQYGTLLFSLFEKSGDPLSPPSAQRPVDLLLNRISYNRSGYSFKIAPVIYQSQVFCESVVPLDDAQVANLKELHFESRNLMKDKLTAPNPSASSGQ